MKEIEQGNKYWTCKLSCMECLLLQNSNVMYGRASDYPVEPSMIEYLRRTCLPSFIMYTKDNSHETMFYVIKSPFLNTF